MRKFPNNRHCRKAKIKPCPVLLYAPEPDLPKGLVGLVTGFVVTGDFILFMVLHQWFFNGVEHLNNPSEVHKIGGTPTKSCLEPESIR